MQCSHCSANIAAEDLQGGTCPYCHTVLPHIAKAHEKAAMVKELIADRDGDGIPDVFGSAAAGGAPPQNGSFSTKVSLNHDGSHQTVQSTVSHSTNVVVHRSGGPIPVEAQRALQRAGVQLPGITDGAPLAPQQVFTAIQTQHRRISRLVWALFIFVGVVMVAAVLAFIIFGLSSL